MCTQMTQKTTIALILATLALVGFTSTGVVATKAFAQPAGIGGSFSDVTSLLDEVFGGSDVANDGGSGTQTDETNQAQDLSEHNTQANSISQEQTGAINQEIGSGAGSEAGSVAGSDSEADSGSTTRSNDVGSTSTSTSGTSNGDDNNSDSTSDISNTGTLGQDHSLNDPVQLNAHSAGDDRSAEVSTSLKSEQS